MGIRPTYEGLMIDPCIPADWKKFEVTRKWRGATYNFKITNPAGVEKGIKSIQLDEKNISNPIPIQDVGSVHEVVVVMG